MLEREKAIQISRITSAVILLMLAVGLYILNLAPGVVGTYHDDGIYVVTAKALATGQGYKIISLPEPLAQTKYPILYPFLLSLIWRVFPDFPGNLIYMKALSVIATVLFLVLAYHFLIKFGYASKNLALAAVAAAAFLPGTLYFSGMILSDMPYALIAIAVLYLLELHDQNSDPPYQYLILAAALAGLACLTRSVGMALSLAAFLYFIYQRRPKQAVLFLAIVILIMGPWLLWARSHAPQAFRSQVEIYYSSYTQWVFEYLGASPLNKLLNVFAKNMVYSLANFGAQVFPLISYLPVFPLFVLRMEILPGLPTLLCLFGLAGVGTGALMWIRKTSNKIRRLDFYLLVYVLNILIWPWPHSERFLVVIFPFAFLYMLRFMNALLKLCFFPLPEPQKQKWIHALLMVVAFTSVLSNLSVDISGVIETRKYGWSFDPAKPHPGIPWTEMLELFAQIRSRTPPQSVLACLDDPMTYLYTERRAISHHALNPIRSFYEPQRTRVIGGSPEEIFNNLKIYKIDYLIFQPRQERATHQHLKVLLAKYPELLAPQFMTKSQRILVFKVNSTVIAGAAMAKP
ncbi:MAG: glycosyltransferase family 39 protein [Acidobacteria bacterium]|nr:glycosyltransferase family 39 protein [Acidobacteriota bacterium]MBI3656350.1 glycosyltransferase family 39 protein [Acidobacteriota bacterium]